MRLDLMVEGQEGVSWNGWVALGEACEAHGITTLLRSDHYQDSTEASPPCGALDAWGTICGLAAKTTTLRLGTLVSPATFRHPSELAKLVTTADHISGGRVELGLGAGWSVAEHAAYGFRLPPMRERIDLLAEQLEIISGTFRSRPDRPFSFSGAHYQLQELVAVPTAVQQPGPPLIMGGSAGPRVAALAARFADEYNVGFVTLREMQTRKSKIDAACTQAGRAPIAFSFMTGVVVAETEAEVDARCTRLETRLGLPRGELRRTGFMNWIIGTTQDVAERLQEFKTAGAGRVICNLPLPDDLETVAVVGERLAPMLSS